MKKSILALFILTSLCACTSKKLDVEKIEDNSTQEASAMCITIDGCQYVYYTNNGETAICHKGNCTNKIHQTLTP